MVSDGAGDVILETHGLTKEFRGFVAVKDVSLREIGRASCRERV